MRTGLIEFVDKVSGQNQIGGTTRNLELLKTAHKDSEKRHHYYRFETSKILGTDKYMSEELSKLRNRQQRTAVESGDDLGRRQELSQQTTRSTQNSGSNQRVRGGAKKNRGSLVCDGDRDADKDERDRFTALERAIQYADGKSAREVPWRFSAVAGVLTSENYVDARLFKNHRQLSRSKVDVHSSERNREGDSGEHP